LMNRWLRDGWRYIKLSRMIPTKEKSRMTTKINFKWIEWVKCVIHSETFEDTMKR
jgi:hypothetical protein